MDRRQIGSIGCLRWGGDWSERIWRYFVRQIVFSYWRHFTTTRIRYNTSRWWERLPLYARQCLMSQSRVHSQIPSRKSCCRNRMASAVSRFKSTRQFVGWLQRPIPQTIYRAIRPSVRGFRSTLSVWGGATGGVVQSGNGNGRCTDKVNANAMSACNWGRRRINKILNKH